MSKKTAFIFPGQGSQKLGMLATLAENHMGVENHKRVLDTFGEASDILGYDLWRLCQDGPQADLDQTDKTQPALLTASVAIWRLWDSISDEKPAYLAGHSLGEYSALVCAGSLQFTDAVKLVQQRGQFMQQAVSEGEGAMAAILGLDDDAVTESCEKAAIGLTGKQIVSPVNFNSPGQVVIAGEVDAVNRAIELCKEAGAKRAMPLAVSVPSHCALMEPAAEKLAAELNQITIESPQISVIQNFTARPETDPVSIRENLVKQLYNPVLWTQSVKYMFADDVINMLECGPGSVLAGLNKRIERSIQSFTLGEKSKLDDAVNFFIENQ